MSSWIQHMTNKVYHQNNCSETVASDISRPHDPKYINWLKTEQTIYGKTISRTLVPLGPLLVTQDHSVIKITQTGWRLHRPNKDKYPLKNNSRDCCSCHWSVYWPRLHELAKGSTDQIRTIIPWTTRSGNVATVVGWLNNQKYIDWLKAAHTK